MSFETGLRLRPAGFAQSLLRMSGNFFSHTEKRPLILRRAAWPVSKDVHRARVLLS